MTIFSRPPASKAFDLNTIDGIVAHCLANVDAEEIKFLREGSGSELIWAKMSFGRHIRNAYDLWSTSLLTKDWRNNPEMRTIINGVDYSEDHPDKVSEKIMTLVLRQD